MEPLTLSSGGTISVTYSDPEVLHLHFRDVFTAWINERYQDFPVGAAFTREDIERLKEWLDELPKVPRVAAAAVGCRVEAEVPTTS